MVVGMLDLLVQVNKRKEDNEADGMRLDTNNTRKPRVKST